MTDSLESRGGTWMAVAAGTLICGLMILTVLDVLGRTFASGIDGALEFTEVLLVATVFAGMASAQLNRVHVATPVLTDRLPIHVAASLRRVGQVITLAFLIWAVVATWGVGVDSFRAREYRFGIAEVPVWPAKLVIPLGFAAFAGVVAGDLVRALRARGAR